MVKRFTLSLNSVISWILKFFMLVVSVYFFLTGGFLSGGLVILALLISLIPAIVNRSYDTNLPWSLDFLLTLWVAFAVLGEIRFYNSIWWWDDFLHFGGTAVLVYLAFVLVYALNFTKKIRLSIPLIGFFTFLFGVAFGAIWELAEFYFWQTTGTDALGMGVPPDFQLGLFDTFSDLKLDLFGSTLVALFGMHYVATQRHLKLREWMRPFVKIFGKKIQEEGIKIREKFSKSKKR